MEDLTRFSLVKLKNSPTTRGEVICKNWNKRFRKWSIRLPQYWSVFDVSEKEKEIFSIEQNAGESQFWAAPKRAQIIMQRLSRLKEIVTTWRELELQGNSLLDLVELSINDGDGSLEEQISSHKNNIYTLGDSIKILDQKIDSLIKIYSNK